MISLIGQKFNRWTVLDFHSKKHRHGLWICRCSCGNQKVVFGENLKRGLSKSCGCWNIEQIIRRSTIHGHNRPGKTTKTYASWVDMLTRCNNKNSTAYKWYGGRGIRVCDRWKDFRNFLNDMGEKPEGLEIDRINNNGNYQKDNCRWVDRVTNANNVRSNRLVFYNGKRQTMAQWCRELHLHYRLTIQRLNRDHWTIKRAFEKGD